MASGEITAWVERIRSGDARALARALSEVENRGAAAEALLKALFPLSGHGTLMGVTGAPGAGKSTLVDQLARGYRERGETVGILAVDPSSPFSAGAILGDRIRMQGHFADPGIFIRSMATRGSLGGLAATTADAAVVLDAAGRQRILIETVGVGQDEVDIVKLADIVLVLLVPGMGDEVQALKAGIMEIADIFVINKSDRGADRLQQEVRALLSLAKRPDGWRPPIVRTVATLGQGTTELLTAIDTYETFLSEGGRGAERRRAHWLERLRRLLRDRAFETFVAPNLDGAEMETRAAAVAERRQDPYSATEELLRRSRL